MFFESAINLIKILQGSIPFNECEDPIISLSVSENTLHIKLEVRNNDGTSKVLYQHMSEIECWSMGDMTEVINSVVKNFNDCLKHGSYQKFKDFGKTEINS